jgi:pimeloyl-ACP methyl ester carboxylesterase
MLAPSDLKDRPIVLIIPGSGPTDQDGNSPMGIKASTYRLLAQELARQGIASVRIDKRGMYASAAAIADPNAVTIADYTSDVRVWANEIRKITGAKCIWLLGHSEGGLVALAAAQAAPTVDGVILAAVAGRPLGEVLRSQLRSNPANAPVLGEAFATLQALEAGKRIDATVLHPALRSLFRPEIQAFLIDVFTYDPISLLAGISKPVLILQGTKDLQVGEEDASRLAAVSAGGELVLLPGVNHVLKYVPGDDRASNLATYGNPDLPLAAGVVDAIAGFIESHRGKG